MHPIVRVACAIGPLLADGLVRAGDIADRARDERLEDFDAVCRLVADHDADFDRQRTDWAAIAAR